MDAPRETTMAEFLSWVAFVLIVMALTACVVFGLGGCDDMERDAGENIAQGAGEYIDSPAGQAKIDAATERAINKAVATLDAKWQAKMEEAKQAAANGTATWWQLILAGLGGYPVMRAARRKLWTMFGGGNGTTPSDTNGGPA